MTTITQQINLNSIKAADVALAGRVMSATIAQGGTRDQAEVNALEILKQIACYRMDIKRTLAGSVRPACLKARLDRRRQGTCCEN